MTTITEKDLINTINDYSDSLAALTLIEMEAKEAFENSLTDEEKAMLEEIEAKREEVNEEFASAIEFAREQAAKKKSGVANMLLASGVKKIKGSYNQAYTTPGKVTITREAFEKIVKAHPELRPNFKVGNDFVTVK